MWTLCSTAAVDAAPRRLTKNRPAATRPVTDHQGEFADFSQWKDVADFIDQMVERHAFDRPALEALFRATRYVESSKQLIKPAPSGRPKNWQAYRARFVESVRIDGGVQFWNDNADALSRAELRFGVPADSAAGPLALAPT